MAGKGSKPRPVKLAEYLRNYGQIDWALRPRKERRDDCRRTKAN